MPALLLMLVLAPHQAFAARGSVVYGNDDRREHYEIPDPAWRERADAMVALVRSSALTAEDALVRIHTVPYGASLGLCPEEPFYQQEKAAFCSGFLVGPDLVATAGHCVRTPEACSTVSFIFGFRLESPGAQPRSVPAGRVFRCKELVHAVAEANGEDFAVVRLDRRVTHVKPLTLRRSGRPSPGDPLLVMGFPSGLPLKIAGGARVRSLEPQHFVANLDTYGGNSGSAVFDSVSGEVQGILVRGERDFVLKDNCRVSYRCGDDQCRGEDVTLIERLLAFIP